MRWRATSRAASSEPGAVEDVVAGGGSAASPVDHGREADGVERLGGVGVAWRSTPVPFCTSTVTWSGVTAPGGRPRKMLSDRLGLVVDEARARRRRRGRGSCSIGEAWFWIVVGVEAAEALGERAQVVVRQAGVDADGVDGDVEQAVERERVGERVEGEHPLERLADEELLAGDAPEVAGGVGVPVAVGVLELEVRGPGEGERGRRRRASTQPGPIAARPELRVAVRRCRGRPARRRGPTRAAGSR